MNDFARKVTTEKLESEQEMKARQLGLHLLEMIRKGEIVSDPTLNVICVDGTLQVIRMDFISLVSTDAIESFVETYILGYKLCPECKAEMEQYIVSEEIDGIIWNWICPKCKTMDPKGWWDEKPKGEKNERN